MSLPTASEIDRIVHLADPIVRNLGITQCYHELSVAMRPLAGGAANWCTFATWASKQAGQTIRGEDLAAAFDDFARRSPEIAAGLEAAVDLVAGWAARPDVTALHATLRRALDPRAAFARAADAVARGNKKVFEEIGREFARFLATCAGEGVVEPDQVARFCDGLRPGEPPEGQRLLREAFTAYARAGGLTDRKERAELVYLANLLVGLHEQTRLQPEIVAALNASAALVDELRPRLLAVLLPSGWLRVRHVVARLLGRTLPLDEAIDRLVEQVQALVRQITTRWLMTLHLPDGVVLRLGEDLLADVPDVLRQITRPDLRALLARIDPTPDSATQSGAEDWGDLHERMHFIADLFRTYHERPTLFDPPFSPEQVAALKAGRRPDGRL